MNAMLTLTLVAALSLNAAHAKKPKACAKDLKCFIEASRTCAPAKVEHALDIDLAGMKNTIDRTYEITADSGAKCTLEVKTLSMKFDASPEAIRNIKKASPGTSDADIRKEIDKQNAQQAKALPKPMTCHFAPGFLANIMAKLRDGSFDSADWDVGCPKSE
ncbi:MAG: hypothetical protein JST54_00550 [Deltaproteobacteria bacterium]|nr:hypothetical protein [Deltaproteobacteria bacterium]